MLNSGTCLLTMQCENDVKMIRRQGDVFQLSERLTVKYECWDDKEAAWLWLSDDKIDVAWASSRCLWAQRNLRVEPGDESLSEEEFRKKYEWQGYDELVDSIMEQALALGINVCEIEEEERT